MTIFQDPRFLIGEGVVFSMESDLGDPRTFMLPLEILEKISGMKVIRQSTALTLLHHHRSVIERMCVIAFKETPNWSNNRPYPLSISKIRK